MLILIEKTYAETTHIITKQRQKINNTKFNVIWSLTVTYIHKDNYYVLFLSCVACSITNTIISLNRNYKEDTMIKPAY